MAFKMKRPFRMNGVKKSGLKLGRKMKNAGVDNQISGDEFQSGDTGSGLFYNSKMGPMQMMSPSALKQTEEESEIQKSHEEIQEKAAKTDWETGSTLEEGDYATYGQAAYDFEGNVIENFQGHEETGPVIMDQNGRPYSEQEGTDELIFWAPVDEATDEEFPGGEKKSERDKFNDEETYIEENR